MQNQPQKINQENNQLRLELESKLDLLVKGQEKDFNKLESIENDIRKDFIALILGNEEYTEQEIKDYVRNTLWEIQPYL